MAGRVTGSPPSGFVAPRSSPGSRSWSGGSGIHIGAGGPRPGSTFRSPTWPPPGGWKGTQTLTKCYQQPDDATILAVVLGGAELREKGVPEPIGSTNR